MLRWSIALFRVFGIRLEVHVSFVLLLAYAAFGGWKDGGGFTTMAWSVSFVLLLFTVVVLHELGHCLAARRYGIRTNRILLLPIGGMAEFDSIPREPRRELLIAIAGPAVNYALIALLLLFFGWPGPLGEIDVPAAWAEIPRLLLYVNIVMGVFNLIPAFPMDGGRMLRAILATRFDHLTATRWAARIGQVLALAFIGIALWQELWVPAALFLFIAYGAETEYRFVRTRELYSGLIVANVTRSDFVGFSPDATVAAAFETMRRSIAQDLLLIGASGPVGIVPRTRFAAALRSGGEQDSLASHAVHDFAVLQAEWPLLSVLGDLKRGKQRLYPVYSAGRMIGVCDARRIDEGVRLIRQTARRAR
ncbi:MAG TPA: site-2 protease family protein [Opitutaceae bacterium]|nr:site-2 protease family protein [Opitutaceae bacterium]